MAEQQPDVKIRIVKKKGGHAAAHGGAWKVAYADLVTALMAFFLLMWLLGSANANTKAGIAGMFKEGMGFFSTPQGKQILEMHDRGILPGGRGMGQAGDGADAPTAQQDLAEKERKAMEQTAQAIEQVFAKDEVLQAFKDQVSMDYTDEGLRIQIQDKAANVLFDSGSARLKPYTLAILKEIAKELGKLPNHIAIGGHTDAKQYSGAAYTNWELSADRANSARRVLESSGLQPSQVRRVTGYADSVPMEGKSPEDEQNRRISIIVMSTLVDREEAQRHASRGTHRSSAPSNPSVDPNAPK